MEINDRDIELLDLYMQGELDNDSATIVAQRLSKEGVLRQLYNDMMLIPPAMERYKTQEKIELFQDLERQGEWPNYKGKSVKHVIFGLSRINLMNIAATILLLFAAGWWFSKPSLIQQDVAALYALNDTPPVARPDWIVITRSAEKTMENVDPQLIRGYNLYEAGLYTEAAKALEEYYNQTDDQEALYYAGISYAAIGNIKKAKQCLHKTTHPKEGDFINELLTKINKE